MMVVWCFAERRAWSELGGREVRGVRCWWGLWGSSELNELSFRRREGLFSGESESMWIGNRLSDTLFKASRLGYGSVIIKLNSARGLLTLAHGSSYEHPLFMATLFDLCHQLNLVHDL